ncbi:MAG: HEAT repeat domain-containing protein [Pirellulales bacterium]|nr:HEAT repeat domain-containing protein [Pirellulales bacterium]
MTEFDYYFELYRKGDEEGAFFGLLESGSDGIADIMTAFRAEPDTQARAFLLRVLRNIRNPSTLALLGEAICDKEPIVWKEAIDGLVSLASPSAIKSLQTARTKTFDNQADEKEFHEYIDEAIKQLKTDN